MRLGSCSSLVRGLTAAILLSVVCLNAGYAEEPLTEEEVTAILEYTDQNDIDLDDVELLSPPHYEIDIEFGDFINARLAESELDVQLSFAETYTATSDPESMGRFVFFNDRTALIPIRFVPGDPRRIWSGPPALPDDITSMIDPWDPPATVGALDAATAITRATDTWDALESANLPINQTGLFGPLAPRDLGNLQAEVTNGAEGLAGIVPADILHGGFLSPAFFDAVFGNGAGNSILAVTYFYIFKIRGTDIPTDIDDNGMLDTAFVEIYYNKAYSWGIDVPTGEGYDVETTALHEVGHALSLPHWGKSFVTLKNGRVHFAPRAVMNANYTGLLQEPTGRDIGLFSEIWANWPQQ